VIVPDANLLLYAYDASFPRHPAARAWWERAMNGSEPVGLPPVVVLAFVRLTTHPSVAADPKSVAEVREVVDSWLQLPHVRILPTSGSLMRRFFDLLVAAGVGGNLSTDAMIAAHALDAGARLFTNDRDFSRFPGLVTVNPLADGCGSPGPRADSTDENPS
jgi:hypothetical protein